MKRNSLLAMLAALVFGITSFATAQGNFYPESTNSWQPDATDSAPAPAVHYGRTGNLRLKAPVKVAGGVLKPGDYQVRMVETPDEHYVEFSKTAEISNPPEGMSPYEDRVVAEVPCTMEQLNAAVARTELLPKTDNTVAQLEIRGEKVVHLF